MKRGLDHTVPLSTQAIGILKAQPVYNWTPLFFPGLRGKPMSDVTVRMTVRRAGFPEATAHGMRSTFRDWCGETGVSRELAELALNPTGSPTHLHQTLCPLFICEKFGLISLTYRSTFNSHY